VPSAARLQLAAEKSFGREESKQRPPTSGSEQAASIGAA
jgi:hypothetical protein